MKISDTHQACRYTICHAVKNNYEVILEILRDEINNNNDMDVAQAIGILNIFS